MRIKLPKGVKDWNQQISLEDVAIRFNKSKRKLIRLWHLVSFCIFENVVDLLLLSMEIQRLN